MPRGIPSGSAGPAVATPTASAGAAGAAVGIPFVLEPKQGLLFGPNTLLGPKTTLGSSKIL